MRLFRILAVLILTATLAQAHAFLDHAEPKVGATIKDSPTTVQIWFNQDVKPAGSSIAVFNTKGEEIDLKNARVALDNQSLMTVGLPHLSTGIYQVVWNAVCKLGHHTSGHFAFTVAGQN